MIDIINGFFESIGGLLLWLSCYRLYQHKEVKGVSMIPIAFYASWGYWNLFYYPSLNQWFSFVGGIVVISANTTWVIMAIYYKYAYTASPESGES